MFPGRSSVHYVAPGSFLGQVNILIRGSRWVPWRSLVFLLVKRTVPGFTIIPNFKISLSFTFLMPAIILLLLLYGIILLILNNNKIIAECWISLSWPEVLYQSNNRTTSLWHCRVEHQDRSHPIIVFLSEGVHQTCIVMFTIMLVARTALKWLAPWSLCRSIYTILMV